MMSGIFSLEQPSCAIAIAQIREDILFPTQRLPKEMIKKSLVLPAHRQLQFLTARILLAELLHHYLGIEKLPQIKTGKNGRPHFESPDLPDFNISHSGGYIMVALSQFCHIGIDIEKSRPRSKLLALAEYSFSPKEYRYLCKLDTEKQKQLFWQLWTIRESMLKLVSKGVWQMKQIEIDLPSQSVISEFSQNVYSLSHAADPIYWAITTDRPLDISNISYWQATEDLTHLHKQPLPDLITISSQ